MVFLSLLLLVPPTQRDQLLQKFNYLQHFGITQGEGMCRQLKNIIVCILQNFDHDKFFLVEPFSCNFFNSPVVKI